MAKRTCTLVRRRSPSETGRRPRSWRGCDDQVVPVHYRHHGTVGQSSRAERYPQASGACSESPQAGSEPSTGAGCRRSIAATSLGVAGRMEGHPNVFSKQANCFSSPPARGTRSFLDRLKPPRKCRLKECSPGETWYTLICLGEITPTFEPSRKTLTTPPSPIAGRWRRARPRPSRDTARTTTRVGNAGQSRLGLATIGWSLQRRHPCPARCPRPGLPRQHRIFQGRGSQFCLTPIGARRTGRLVVSGAEAG